MAVGCDLFTRRDLHPTVATGCGQLGGPRQTISLVLGHTSMLGTAAVAPPSTTGPNSSTKCAPLSRSGLITW